MGILSLFRKQPPSTASIAKERLRLLVAYERSQSSNNNSYPDYFDALRQDIIDVLRKYIDIDDDQINVDLDKQDSGSILEINIPLPERKKN